MFRCSLVAAHATGSRYRSAPVGDFGDAEVFSLHATKSIDGLEGGIVATNDDDVAARVRLFRNFGFVAEDAVSGVGIDAKMNEFSAAMALANLECYDQLEAHDREINAAYRQGLAGLDGISVHELHAGLRKVRALCRPGSVGDGGRRARRAPEKFWPRKTY